MVPAPVLVGSTIDIGKEIGLDELVKVLRQVPRAQIAALPGHNVYESRIHSVPNHHYSYYILLLCVQPSPIQYAFRRLDGNPFAFSILPSAFWAAFAYQPGPAKEGPDFADIAFDCSGHHAYLSEEGSVGPARNGIYAYRLTRKRPLVHAGHINLAHG